MRTARRSILRNAALAAWGALALDLACPIASAQVSGNFGGRGQAPPQIGLQNLGRDEAGAFIRIEGSCELRLPADGLRVVFALTSENAVATECWKAQRARREEFVAALAKAGLAADAVEVDFISMLPVYDWKPEQRDGQTILVEHLGAQRLQENVHVAVADEAAARHVIEVALDHGVTDVVAVDYWSRQSEAKRREALEAALVQAQAKAKLLLAAFATPPLLANVQEATQLLTPSDLYRSFENVYQADERTAWNSNVPRINAPRPKNTFYEGFRGNVDRGATGPAMRPEISVVATVDLYYESPAHERTPPTPPKSPPPR